MRTAFLLLLLAANASATQPNRLEIYPKSVKLIGPAATQRLVVVGFWDDGSTRDLTKTATFQVADDLARFENGKIVPNRDGKTQVVAQFEGTKSTVPVEIDGHDLPRKVSFKNEIVPTLTKLGCNMGSCHGAQHGKGGFKISLLGFEPDPDYTAIVKSAEGRRVTPFAPDESLLLLKPTLAVAHGGGKKLDADSPEYALIKLWLEQGATAPVADDPKVTKLEIFPETRRMTPDSDQQFVVMATYSDGSVRDVTDVAKFDPINEGQAKVDATGHALAISQGEAGAIARFMGFATIARMTMPYGFEKPFEFDSNNVIDQKVAAKWRSLGLAPSRPCTDAEFLRRAMLDTIGTTPTPFEIETFVADKSPDKRAKLVDKLLDRPEYVDFWTLKWGDLLRVNTDKLGAQGMLAFNLWLRDSFRSNKPLNRMVEELVTAQGSIFTNGPANYFRVANNPEDLAETTAQVFMGVRLQCAKCHHHPFESYGQDDYYGLAAYFSRIRTKASQEFGLFGNEQVIYVANAGDVRQPRTGKVMAPRPLNDEPADDPVDRRRALARWLNGPKNPWLARSVANRYWGYLMGKGLVTPIDDMRDTNPPSNPELLDSMAESFIASGYDLKALLRLILTSRVYSLSAQATPDNRLDENFFTHYRVKRLTAEQLLDALNYATGTTEKFNLRPVGTRAISLPDTNTPSYFLDTFGRPVRATACECERSPDPTLGQALHLMNSDLIQRKLSQPDSRLSQILRDPKLTDHMLIRSLYLYSFNREPNGHEVETAAALIEEAPDRKTGAQDLFWGLLNSKEFVFNH